MNKNNIFFPKSVLHYLQQIAANISYLPNDEMMMNQRHKYLPKRIILIRHGETEVNEDEKVLQSVPNHRIKLSEEGCHHAEMTGSKIKKLVSKNGELKNWNVLFYVSPSKRTRETMERIIGDGNTFSKDKVIGVREECRLREQHFGNFQEMDKRNMIKRKRCSYGKFFFRVPDGESSADVSDRVSSFIEVLRNDMEMNKFKNGPSNEMNLIIVSHGLTILLFLMKWFNWTVEQFEDLTNPTNCEYRVLELGCNGEYSLAIHHSVKELREWGLSDDMINDQKLQARGYKAQISKAKRLKSLG